MLLSAWLGEHRYDAPYRDAVLEYVRRESGFRPNVVGRSGVCLFQWAGSRRRKVLALGRGQCPDWRIQVEFADREMRNERGYQGFWDALPGREFEELRRGFGRGGSLK